MLFDQFEALDAMAPVEIVDPLPNYHIKFISPAGRHKTSSKGIVIATIAISNPEFKQNCSFKDKTPEKTNETFL